MDFFLHQVERVIFIFLQDLLAHEWFFFVLTDGDFLLRNINICFLSPPIEKCLISFSDEFVSASFPSEAVLFDPKKS
jgi:hypothetical protein